VVETKEGARMSHLKISVDIELDTTGANFDQIVRRRVAGEIHKAISTSETGLSKGVRPESVRVEIVSATVDGKEVADLRA
jgi:hypothetical protein